MALVVVCVGSGNSGELEFMVLLAESRCAEGAGSVDVWAGPVVLRVGLMAEWPGSRAEGTGLGCSPCVGSGCAGGLGPWTRLSRPAASTEASARAASTLASLIWLRVRL